MGQNSPFKLNNFSYSKDKRFVDPAFFCHSKLYFMLNFGEDRMSRKKNAEQKTLVRLASSWNSHVEGPTPRWSWGRDHMEKCFCHKIGCLSPYVRFGDLVAKVDVRSGKLKNPGNVRSGEIAINADEK